MTPAPFFEDNMDAEHARHLIADHVDWHYRTRFDPNSYDYHLQAGYRRAEAEQLHRLKIETLLHLHDVLHRTPARAPEFEHMHLQEGLVTHIIDEEL